MFLLCAELPPLVHHEPPAFDFPMSMRHQMMAVSIFSVVAMLFLLAVRVAVCVCV